MCVYMYVCMFIGGSPSGCGGGGATMALITQVQFLQLMARIGGSQAQTGLAYFANSLGE
jgi:hypothetical protein